MRLWLRCEEPFAKYIYISETLLVRYFPKISPTSESLIQQIPTITMKKTNLRKMYFIIETQISETWKLYLGIFLFKIIALVERSVELLWGNTDNCSLEMLKWQVFTLGFLNPVWVTLDLNRAWQVPRFLLALLAPGSCAHTLPLVTVAMTANITCPGTCHANHQNHQKWFHEGGRAS